MADLTEAKVVRIPNCDFPHPNFEDRPALYDAATSTGQWAYMCQEHFTAEGATLGLGRGQKLVLISP